MNKTQFDAYAEKYDEELKELLGFWGGKDLDKFAEYKVQLVKDILPNDINNLLEFGCGTGRNFYFLKKYFGETVNYYGCDVSDESLKIAKRLFPFANFFNNQSLDSIKRYGLKYDLVLITCVLHHIDPKDRQKWIDEIMNNLKVGGYIAIFEHNIKNPKTRSIVKDPRNPVDDINWMLSMRDILSLFDNVKNKEVVWKGYTLFSPVRFGGILAVEKLLKWLPLGAQQCVVIRKNG